MSETTTFNPEDYPGLTGIRDFVRAGGLDERDTDGKHKVESVVRQSEEVFSALNEGKFKTCIHCKLPSRNTECDSCYKIQRNRELSAECMICGDHAVNGRLCDDCNLGLSSN